MKSGKTQKLSFLLNWRILSVYLFLLLGVNFNKLQAQATSCATADPLCTMEGVTYPAGVNAPPAEPGNNYGCLLTQPNAAWFYVEIGIAGNIVMDLTNSNTVDIDFALWGPFSDLTTAISNCGSLGPPTDCSYSPSAFETVNIPTSTVGQIYILLITNFSNQPTDISAIQTGGNGSTDCSDICFAEGGQLNQEDVTGCFTDANLNLNITPTNSQTDPNYSYQYVVSLNGIVFNVLPNPDLSSLPPGDYEICGFSVNNDDLALMVTFIGSPLALLQAQFSGIAPPFCGDFSDDCFNATIGDLILPTFLDTMLCIGECIEVGGQQICFSGEVTLESQLGCDSVVNVIIIPIPPDFTEIDIETCQGECVDFNGEILCPPGTFTAIYMNEAGCDSTVVITLIENDAEAIIVPNPPDFISCSNSFVTLDGSLSVPANSLSWEGPNGFIGNDNVITVTEPGDYTLTVINNSVDPPCIATETVTVSQDPSVPNLFLAEDPEICEGQSVDLATLGVADIGGVPSIITYHSGTPAGPFNILGSTLVSPSITTTYYALATFGDCSDELPITVTVVPPPTADFEVTNPNCSDQFALVTYTGTGSIGADYMWDFDGGTATPGIGQGPHQVTWPTAGVYNISLTVDEGGCLSEENIQSVTIEDPLEDPVITCGDNTISSVTFMWEEVIGNNGYIINVITGQTGTQTGNTFTVDGLDPGEVVEIEVIAIGNAACGDASSTMICESQNCVSIILEIDPVADICLTPDSEVVTLGIQITGGNGMGTGTWDGPGITDPNIPEFDPVDAGVGSHTITYNYVENDCDYSTSTVINVLETPTADFTATSPVCINENSDINYTGTASMDATFTWSFDGGTASPGTGIGPHTVSWTTGGTKTLTLIVQENGCTSEPFSVEVEVDEPLSEPLINCNTTTNSIEFAWNTIEGADTYTVTVLSGASGTMTSDTTYEVTGLSPGDEVTIEVAASGSNVCGSSTAQLTCSAQDCIPVEITIDPVSDICLDANATEITLVASQMGGAGGGTFTWSGDGITDTAAGTFDPNMAMIGANTIVVTYQEGNCSYNGSIIINVFEVPTATFDVVSPVCIGENSIINYTGSASSNATFNWNFDTGIADPGTGAGPHQVNWTEAGTYTVELSVSENNCESETVQVEVVVEAPLPEPEISCNASTDMVQFIWNQISGADGYIVTVLSGASGTQIDDTTYVVTGLSPGDLISIEVEVINPGACPNSIAQASCIAQDCPTVDLSIDPVADICLDVNTMAFDLIANADGGSGNGVFTWSGDGIIDTENGTFDPNSALIGENIINLVYEEGNCAYNTMLSINVFEVPTSDFTASSPICISNTSIVTYGGSGGIAATYEWDFDGGMATPGIGAGPHEVSWDTPGIYTITCTVSENGCTSEISTQMVTVDPVIPDPVVNCNSTTTSVEFVWNSDPLFTNYSVNVISGSTGTFTSDTSYQVTGLVPTDMITIELTAEGNTACGSVTVEHTCEAQECPDIDFEIQNPSPLCNNEGPITFVWTDPNTGTATWEGPCIIDPANGVFDPALGQPGPNEVIFTYTANGCDYSETITVTVVPAPSSGFTVESPICVTSTSTVTFDGVSIPGTTYIWGFGDGAGDPGTGVGPHEVQWSSSGIKTITLNTIDANGCQSETTTVEVQVDDPLDAPVVNCNTTTQSVEFTWDPVPGATSYSVNVLTGQGGTFTTETSYLVENLDPNEDVEITVFAEGDTACDPSSTTITCTAQDCPEVNVVITEVPPICFGGFGVPFNLEATVDGNPVSGFWDGNGIIDPDLGTFDMVVAGFDVHQIVFLYTVDNCTYSASTLISILEFPTVDFSFDSPICEGDISNIEFTGTASDDANYTWDFDGGVATPGGNDPGPHTVTWSTGGTKTVSLIVEDQTCESGPVSYEIEVETPLAEPDVSCNTTTESVEFVWDDISGAEGYNITVTSGQTGTQPTATSFLVENLNPLDVVTIEIEVIGSGPCGSTFFTAECIAGDCPDVIIDIDPVSPICLQGLIEQVDLVVNVSGGLGGGIGTWDGPGIPNPNQDTFDPLSAGVGSHTLTYTYVEANCTYSNSITIDLVEPPSADAGAPFTLICEAPNDMVQLGGSGTTVGAGISYDWDAQGGAFPGDSTVANPIVTVPGTYTLNVINTALGCSTSSEVVISAAQDTPVAEIAISEASCFGENDGIIEILNVTGGEEPYFYSLNGGNPTTNPEFTNLTAGAYELTVVDVNGCSNSLTLVVNEPSELEVSLVAVVEGDNIIQFGDTIQLQAVLNVPMEDVDVIQWEPPQLLSCDTCTMTMAFPIETTTFTVTVESGECEDSDNLTVVVEELMFPNAISPNGDGKNETFVIPGLERYDNPRMTIVNRWGSVIWDSQPYQNDWGGTNQSGKALPEGTYYYVLRLDLKESEIITGHVTVIR